MSCSGGGGDGIVVSNLLWVLPSFLLSVMLEKKVLTFPKSPILFHLPEHINKCGNYITHLINEVQLSLPESCFILKDLNTVLNFLYIFYLNRLQLYL